MTNNKKSWIQILREFWISNLEQNVKKISIGFGSLPIVIITSCTMPTELFLASIYGAGISFGTMVIMSVFGKNGNHYPSDPQPELPQPKSEPEPELPKEKIILP